MLDAQGHIAMYLFMGVCGWCEKECVWCVFSISVEVRRAHLLACRTLEVINREREATKPPRPVLASIFEILQDARMGRSGYSGGRKLWRRKQKDTRAIIEHLNSYDNESRDVSTLMTSISKRLCPPVAVHRAGAAYVSILGM